MALEQDTLMRHVLIDYPEAIGIGGHDKALLDLAERVQIEGKLAGHICTRRNRSIETRRRVRVALQEFL